MHQTSVCGQTSCKCCFQPDESHLLMIKCTFVRYDSHNQNPYSRLLLSVCGRVSFAKMSASIKNVDAAEFEVVKQ